MAGVHPRMSPAIEAFHGSNRYEALKRLEQYVRLHRLAQVGVEARLHAALNVLVEGVGGQGDDGHRLRVGPVQSPYDPGSLQAVQLRHSALMVSILETPGTRCPTAKPTATTMPMNPVILAARACRFDPS